MLYTPHPEQKHISHAIDCPIDRRLMLILLLLGSLCIIQCFHHETEVCHLRRYFIFWTAFCSISFHSL